MPRKPAKPQAPATALDFSTLVEAIRQVHDQSASVAKRAVNTSLTVRNWVIGAYIVEYQLHGADRAKYGEQIVEKLADELSQQGIPTCERPRLFGFIAFFRAYPQLGEGITNLWPRLALWTKAIVQTASGQLDSTSAIPSIVRTVSGQSGLLPEQLLSSLSFSHFELLTALDDPLKRAFYEIECIRGNWSVRALKRQIASLYFERSGLSLDKEKLAAMAHETAETAEPKLSIRDPYIFEFLGLKPREVVAESDLEQALLENLQDFLLELGHGFCLEARQKSILIGDTRGFVDLVFYHRILRCHVLFELKVDEFRHEHIGQLNTYVAWFQKNMMREGDNPPIGLLLCTGKDHALVEYALSAMNQRLFVSKYQLELPSKDALQKFLDQKRKEVTGEL
jgi:predicted nuclease of restriction endonuclease-like (RecB) superfamily